MPSRERRYSREELARRGDEIYEQTISPRVADGHHGEFIAIDVDTGEFEVDPDELTASDRLLARFPEAQVWLKRVGYSYVRRFGPRRQLRTA